MKTVIVAIVVCWVVAAHAAPRTVARPSAVLAVASRDAPSAFDGLRAFGVAVNGKNLPDVDTKLTTAVAKVAGARTLDGIDRARPFYVVYVDDGVQQGIVIVARVVDPRALSAGAGSARVVVREDWAAIGPDALVAIAAPYALSTLVAQPVPHGVVATVFAPSVLARYRDEIARGRSTLAALDANPSGMAFGEIATLYFDGALSIAQDVDELRVAFDISGERALVDLSFVPRKGSRLATFVGTQQPSDFALLSSLPEASAFMVGGRLAAGPYRAALVELFDVMYGHIADDLVAARDVVMKAASGEMAMAFTVGGGRFSSTQLYGLSDPAGAKTALAKLVGMFVGGRRVPIFGIEMTYSVAPDPVDADMHGVDMVYDFTNATPEVKARIEQRMPGGKSRMDVGTFGKLFVMTSGSSSKDAARNVIADLRAKRTHAPPPAIAPMLQHARDRKDSIVMTIDLFAFPTFKHAAGASAPFALALGFEGKAMHVRCEVPVSTVHAMRNGP